MSTTIKPRARQRRRPPQPKLNHPEAVTVNGISCRLDAPAWWLDEGTLASTLVDAADVQVEMFSEPIREPCK